VGKMLIGLVRSMDVCASSSSRIWNTVNVLCEMSEWFPGLTCRYGLQRKAAKLTKQQQSLYPVSTDNIHWRKDNAAPPIGTRCQM